MTFAALYLAFSAGIVAGLWLAMSAKAAPVERNRLSRDGSAKRNRDRCASDERVGINFGAPSRGASSGHAKATAGVIENRGKVRAQAG